MIKFKVSGARQFEFTRMNPVIFKNLMHEIGAFVAQELARGN